MSTRSHSAPKHFLVVTSVLALLFAAGSCSRGSSVLEPFPDSPGSGVSVLGVVRSQTGEPLANSVVTLEQIQNGVTTSVRARIERAAAAGHDAPAEPADALGTPLRSAVTDAAGRFTFPGVAPGDYVLSGTHANHLAGIGRVTITAASPTAVQVAIVLTPTGSFYGTTTLENATDHQSTVVYVQGTSYVAVTNPAGGFTMVGVPMGTWTVRATHSRYLDQSTGGTIAAAGDSVALAAMLLRLDSNIPPVAVVIPPTQSVETLPTSFDGTASDKDGSVLRYEWDFEDDGVFDYSSLTSPTTSHVYATPGSRIAKLRVTDDRGAIGLDAVTINVEPAVYVSATTGSPTNPGTRVAPLSTITDGIAKLVTNGTSTVLVANGTYSEAPTFINGKSVLGGYDPSTWVRGATLVQVNVGTLPATANGITTFSEIGQLRFTASAPPVGASSIALRSSGSGAALRFVGCAFVASSGGAGFAGALTGTVGSPGGSGVPGFPGSCDLGHGVGGSGGSSAACPGGPGGRGGLEGANAGVPGTSGTCAGGGGGGSAGGGGDPGAPGSNGFPGTGGSPGLNGTSATGSGSIVGGSWAPLASSAGSAGTTGAGGGGGGGGGGQGGGLVNDGGGNGGGGGGGGGQGGGGGDGGGGGPASIAVFLFSSSPTFTNCSFQSGSGGSGGLGRNGAVGGSGGVPGPGAAVCLAEIGRGGNGGSGGTGGSGGGGAGGPGGPSVGILKSSTSSPTLTGASFTIGFGGAGGGGGTNPTTGLAPSGSTGLSGNIITL